MNKVKLTVRVDEEALFKFKKLLADKSLKTLTKFSIAGWVNEQIKKAVK